MSKYLDPKADLTFKKVFGEHRDLVVSFLNALLPFDSPEEEIKEVLEYLDPELMPRNPLKKYSVVDLRCRDARGRQFVVEMQMMWTSAFKQRVLFNASKAYLVIWISYAGSPDVQEVPVFPYVDFGWIVDNVVTVPLDGKVDFRYEE